MDTKGQEALYIADCLIDEGIFHINDPEFTATLFQALTRLQ